jgi:hypothetical protein
VWLSPVMMMARSRLLSRLLPQLPSRSSRFLCSHSCFHASFHCPNSWLLPNDITSCRFQNGLDRYGSLHEPRILEHLAALHCFCGYGCTHTLLETSIFVDNLIGGVVWAKKGTQAATSTAEDEAIDVPEYNTSGRGRRENGCIPATLEIWHTTTKLEGDATKPPLTLSCRRINRMNTGHQPTIINNL